MSQVVKSDVRQPSVLQDTLVECYDRVGVIHFTGPARREHPRIAGMLAVFRYQQVYGILRDRYFSDRSLRFGTGQRQFAIGIFDILLADGDGFVLCVEVAPEKRRDLALPQARDQLQMTSGTFHVPSTNQHMIPNGFLPQGCNVYLAEAIKKEMKHTPVVTVGALGDPELMESIIAEGRADIVALARPLLADPELPNKLKAGKADQVSPCLRCMACISESFVPYVRYCSRIRRCPSNPTAYKEIPASQVKKAEQPKKVLVIGGGPSGMEAAAELAERGHHVILCERENELGGAMRHAKYVPFKQKVDQLMHVMIRRLERSGAEIRLRTAATPTLVESLHPDVIVAALGAKAKKPEVAGAEHAIIAEDALQRIDSLGQNVAIVGGGLVGCELALQLGMTGRTVHLLSRKKEVCRDAAYLYREGLLMELKKVPVKIYNEAECTAITSEGVTVRNADDREYTLPADTVIWAGGYLPMEDEAEQFRTLAYDFWKIGDCAQVRKIYNARREGYNAGSNI